MDKSSENNNPKEDVVEDDRLMPDEAKIAPIKQSEVPWWTSRRLLLSLTCFIGFFFLYSLRVNLSTAIVCMNKAEEEGATATGNQSIIYNSTNINGTIINVTIAPPPTTTDADGLVCKLVTESTDLHAEFSWDKKLQGFILGAFFWGYTAMQIPSGFLSDRFGPRITVACGMFPVAVLTIMSPWLARGSPYLLLVGRIFIGVGEAMMYPGMQSLWSKWAPPHERSRLVGFAFGGSQLGNALTFPFAGLLCAYGFDGGWPSVFYVTGMLCFLWCCLYVFFARDSPGQMKNIKPIERKYIEQSLGVYGQTVEERLRKRKQDKPWKAIFTSGPVWAILLANACGNYGAYMLLTQMPTYMKEVLKFDIKSNGAFSMIPYLVFWMFTIIGGQIADVLITKNILTIEWTRKLCCALGTVVPGIFLVITGYMDCEHQVEAVIFLTLSMAFCGFQFSSFFINHGDIAPRYAGTVFGFTNTGASVPGILAPYIVGAITPNKTREEWLIAFYIAGAVYCLGAVIYAFMAKGEVQDWAREEVDEFVSPDEEGYPLQGIKETEEDDDEKKTDKNGLKSE
ncbi:uncharacterized transporter slc-17.2-like isoform X2 [Mercenaria mercenaria]|uniref:uncharacterized transporter slc-17.2-like isoform X2 n=1 Tax=Mercenaria mercenaria TaxID=6596 RepID=UPI001E1DD429|nr:uncharacterized transporter slc-17.2-like isoform X2 [Mercenaria mercenaria]XP_045210378.1 uncharacterized transporter slc-17.2-like isoform X2 [Mercenaria mercenaria]